MATANTSTPTVAYDAPQARKSSQKRVAVNTSTNSHLDFATSIQELLEQSKTTVQTYQRKKEALEKLEQVIHDYFPGFLRQKYQNAVTWTGTEVIKAREHYHNVARFEIDLNQYWSPKGLLVIRGRAVRNIAAGGNVNADCIFADKFWARFITNIKVKKLVGNTVINEMSDDVKTQFDLFLNELNADFIKYNKDLLTSTKGREVNTNTRAHGATNPCIDDRIAQFGGYMNEERSYLLPLEAFCNLFSIVGPLPPEIKLVVELTFNQNQNELFESKLGGNDANARANQARFKLTKEPELILGLVEQTEKHRASFEMKFTQQPSYRLWNGFTWETTEKQIPTGINEAYLQFDQSLKQYQWLRLSLQPTTSTKHATMYETYDAEQILPLTKSIEIKGLLTSRSNDTITFDLEKMEDVIELYQMYLAKEHAFGNSRMRLIDYKDSEILKDMVTHPDFTSTRMPLYIDIRRTRGYAKNPDPPTSIVTPQITIKLKNNLTASYKIRCDAYYPSQYNLTVTGEGNQSTKILKFLPTTANSI